MPTLTLRIEDGCPDHQNLELVKKLFDCSTNTGAIYAALEYAAGKIKRENDNHSTERELLRTTERLRLLNMKIRGYFDLQKELMNTPVNEY